MQGNLSDISLSDLLLLATTGKKSGLLKLTRGKESVEVYLDHGTIVHATCPIGDGEKALLYPVTWGEGNFQLQANGSPPAATVNKSAEDILAEVKVMTREWEMILEVIPSAKTAFKIAELSAEHTGPVTVPNVGWRVLTKLDGKRTVQEIADLLRIPFAYVAKVIYNLHKAGLVEHSTPATKPNADLVPAALLNRLRDILTDVIGPMAPLVLRDQIEALGASPESLPEEKLEDLIGLIGKEIGDGELKSRCEQSMLQEIANFKRF